MKTNPARVVAINISPGGIPKKPLPEARVLLSGLEGDGHNHEKHNTPLQAISITDLEDLNDMRNKGFDVYPGAIGENVTVSDLNVDELEIGDRLIFSGGVEIELTKRRKPCYVLDAIHPELKKHLVGRCGFLAKVIRTGTLQPGETIEVRRAAAATCT
ncbi:MAG: hypothetical protein DIU71_19365 [Proteobacteria bacterium]|nr:MAG: hypothetical protein DIU71_19365 [Pseudomonadota bacterium]